MTRKFHVYRDRDSRTYGVYVQPGRDGVGQELIEGGFFRRRSAVKARDEWAKAEEERQQNKK